MLMHVLNVTSCDCDSSAIQAALLRSENSAADCASSSYSRTSLASQMYFVCARRKERGKILYIRLVYLDKFCA